MRNFSVAILLFSGLFLPSTLRGGAEITPRLAAALSTATPGERIAVWIALADKGPLRKSITPEETVTPRALLRRGRVLPAGRLVDATDLPVNEAYVRGVERAGGEIRQRSKWLNAVSAWVPVEKVDEIASLPFVRSLELLGRFRRDPIRTGSGADGSTPHTRIAGNPAGEHSLSSTTALDYGSSLPQVSLLNIPAVHETGNAGQGVLIGVFDNGFRLPNHVAFDSLHVVDTYDFVDHKVSVVPNNPSSSFGTHGVQTLSTIGGYAPGQLIGPAFRASYLLVRTENDSSETPIEEDNWVAGIEWAESLGVQVTSTSLGYLNFDGPYTSWTWEDMNGRTTAITRAAAMAVRKGIVVVNSAGNNGAYADTSINTLNAPADGDSVLAVGAVTPAGFRASFSSVGPSTSIPPRIKPEVMATGTSVFAASGSNATGYTLVQGTSFACPLAAGVAAMILSANPSATPMEVVESMKQTASRASAPNNQYGWGIIDALGAVEFLTSGGGPDGQIPAVVSLQQNYPNPFNPRTRIAFSVPENVDISIRVYDVVGREVAALIDARSTRGVHFVDWDGRDREGAICASGVYFYRCVARAVQSGGLSVITKKMILLR